MSSRSGLKDLVGSPGFQPQLRADIRFLKGPTDDIVIVHDPASDRRFEMYAMECIIAKALDGSRDLEGVSRATMPHVPWATRDQVEKVVTQIAGMGLLANFRVERLERARTPAPIPMTPPPALRPSVPVVPPVPKLAPGHIHGSEMLDDDQDEDGDDPFGEATMVGDGMANGPGDPGEPPVPPAPASYSQPASPAIPPPMGPPPEPAPAVAAADQNAVDMSAWGPAVPAAAGGIDMNSWGAAVPPVDDDDDDDEEEDMSAWGQAPAPGESLSVDALTEGNPGAFARALTPPPADTSKEASWEQEKLEFYQEKWFKRLVKVGVVLAIVGALALIPYPIRVTEECVVQPTLRADVRSQIEGMIVEILVDEGDIVKEGQLLARLEDRDLTYELSRAKSDVESLTANLGKLQTGSRPEEIRQAKARVSAARQDLAIASQQLKRAQNMYKNKVGSKSDFDDARGERQVRSEALGEAQAALRLVEAGFRSEEVKVAEAQLEQAQAEVVHIEKKLALLELRAPIAGHILTPKFSERLHEKIGIGDTVVEIGDASLVRVEVSVREEDADIIALGQTMEVKVHSYPLKSFKGKVTFIAPTIENRGGQRYVRVDAEFDNSDGLLLPRMTGFGEIDTGNSTVLNRISRRLVRWVRVRFLI